MKSVVNFMAIFGPAFVISVAARLCGAPPFVPFVIGFVAAMAFFYIDK
jgi:hypothetical protein